MKSLEVTCGVHERYHGFHGALSDRFPYAIYYLISKDLIDVVVFLDCRRDQPRRQATSGIHRARVETIRVNAGVFLLEEFYHEVHDEHEGEEKRN
jgi:hypothetical protein